MSKHAFLEKRISIEPDNISIVRNEEICVKCGKCKDVCENVIAVGRLYDLESTNDKAICINCGQCANVCPVNSITERYEYEDVKKAINDPDKIVIFSTSPSVRVGLGEAFGMPSGSFVQGKMVSALRKLGANYVLDTNFAADLTIMEEASELVHRITTGSKELPQFTSCCPAWVKFVETFYPDFTKNLSTAKSPIGMQGASIKTYFAKKMNIDPTKIVNIALTPCTAKKMEIRRPEMNASSKYWGIDSLRDMDYVITTRELAKWMSEENIDFAALEDSEYDNLMGEASGAGVIFGNTGGVMEAAIRTAHHLITNEHPGAHLLNLQPVRGYEGFRDATLTIKDINVKVAVVYGTENARIVLEKLKEGVVKYDFIEVMTCPGGCIGGGGQPKNMLKSADEIRKERIASLYKRDDSMTLRNSYQNAEIEAIYKDFYEKPLSEMAEQLLHTHYIDRSSELGPMGMISNSASIKSDSLNTNENVSSVNDDAVKYRCTVCGYIHEGEVPDDYKCPLCGMGKAYFEKVETDISDRDIAKDDDKEDESSVNDDAVKYRCTVCGYIHKGEVPDDYKCPLCGMGKAYFEKVEADISDRDIAKDDDKEDESSANDDTVKYRCTVCGYIHEGEVRDDYKCPLCGMGKAYFEKVEE